MRSSFRSSGPSGFTFRRSGHGEHDFVVNSKSQIADSRRHDRCSEEQQAKGTEHLQADQRASTPDGQGSQLAFERCRVPFSAALRRGGEPYQSWIERAKATGPVSAGLTRFLEADPQLALTLNIMASIQQCH